MRSKNFKLLENILKEIKEDENITELKIAEKYDYTERTVRRYFKLLKDENKIELIKDGKNQRWLIK